MVTVYFITTERRGESRGETEWLTPLRSYKIHVANGLEWLIAILKRLQYGNMKNHTLHSFSFHNKAEKSWFRVSLCVTSASNTVEWGIGALVWSDFCVKMIQAKEKKDWEKRRTNRAKKCFERRIIKTLSKKIFSKQNNL